MAKQKQNSFSDYDKQIQELHVKKMMEVEKGLSSNDPNAFMKASTYIQSLKNAKGKPQAYLFEPFDAQYTGKGYKSSNKQIPYQILKLISELPIVKTVHNTRIFQIQRFLKFSTDDMEEGFTIRKKLSLFEERKKDISKEQHKEIENIVEFLMNSRRPVKTNRASAINFNPAKWDKYKDFDDFIRMTIQDSLTYDQLCFQIQRSRNFDLFGYMPTDASTIRILDTVDPRYDIDNKKKYDEVFGFLPRYAQVYNNLIYEDPTTKQQAVFYPWEMSFEIRNQSTDIRKNMYGTSELETLKDIITYIQNGFTYNGNFFKQGSNPKGFLNIKEGGVSQDVINDFRNAWRTQIAGISNSHKLPIFEGLNLEWIDLQHCLHPETEVYEKNKGLVSLGSIIKDKEKVDIEIWDGDSFNKGQVFKTGIKKLNRLYLSNKTDIKTSPDHKFLVLRDEFPEWVQRKDIKEGDYILINKKEIRGRKSLKFNNQIIDEDLIEIVGWLTGDGWMGDDKNSKRMIKLFYHPQKEQDVLQRHFNILKKYNINTKIYKTIRTDKEILKYKEKYDIKSMIKELPFISICDISFYRWLINFGVKPSKIKKEIPNSLYLSHFSYKNAFLKGFFSADGSISKNGSRIDITISNKTLKHQTKMLLLSEGIRCTSFKLKETKSTFGTYSEDNVLLIKDRDIFEKKIGFIQDYKNNRFKKRKKSLYKENEASIEYRKQLALKIKEFNKSLPYEKRLNKKDLHDLLNIGKGHQKASLSKIIYYANLINYKYPSFLDKYNLEVVTKLEESNEFVEMVDVEMFTNSHQFCANGMIVHNSNKDMEFQMWLEFMIILLCSVYTIDPSELGFHFKQQSQMFGQYGQKERLKHSRDKGLKPLLVFLQKVINKYIVTEINPEYEFVFTGIDLEDEEVKIKNDKSKLDAGFVAFEDMFRNYNDRDYDEKKDTILNPSFISAQQAKMYGGVESNMAVDEMTGEQGGVKNPFEEQEKGGIDDPIVAASLDYIDKAFGYEQK